MKPDLESPIICMGLLTLALARSLLTLTGCPVDQPTEPTTPDCQRYSTASVAFENHSSHSTYDVILDGVRVATIGSGRSYSITVAAGCYSFTFRFSNTTANACSPGTPNLAVGSCQTYYCSSDL